MNKFFSELLVFYQEFFQKSPCLFLALSMLLGSLLALYDYPLSLLFLFFLWVPYFQKIFTKMFIQEFCSTTKNACKKDSVKKSCILKIIPRKNLMPKFTQSFLLLTKKTLFFRIFFSLLFFVFAFLYTKASLFSLPEKPRYITGTFSIHSITPQFSFSKKILYDGILTTTIDGQKQNFPCRFYKKPKEPRLKGNYLYEVKGTIFSLKNGTFLQPSYKKALKKTYSLVEIRYQAKKWVRSYLVKNFSSSILQNLLKALLIAENDDALLRFSFSKVGLQHLMAISGLHFGIVMGFLAFFLSKIFPFRVRALILWLFLLIYFLFLGTSPSIQRAWVMAQVILWAQLLEKRTFSLNALGIALFLAILYNPLDIKNLGLQLSFFASFGLIVLYSPFEQFFSFLIPIRNKKEIFPLPYFLKIPCYFLSFIRSCLAIACSIHLTTLPLIFFYFQKFPLLSLIYNLFYPFLIAVMLCAFLSCLIIDLTLPFVGGIFHHLCEKIFLFFLDPVFYFPACLDISVFLSFSSFYLCLYYIVFFFSLTLINKKAYSEKNAYDERLSFF
jgi:competence protein ComEC